MKQTLYISMLALLVASCAREASVAPETTGEMWGTLRFHVTPEGPGGMFEDLQVAPDGALSLNSGRGEGSSARGLLAGERLETLARLLDALPPQSYASEVGCELGAYFVSIERGGSRLIYSSGPCDAGAPAGLAAVSEFCRGAIAEVRTNRVQSASSRVLLAGSHSEIVSGRREVLRSRDALVGLLAAHSPSAPLVIPRVDWTREMVVAEFLGDRLGATSDVSVQGVEWTEGGWLRVRFLESIPGEGCTPASNPTRPFVLVTVPRVDGDLLFVTDRIAEACH